MADGRAATQASRWRAERTVLLNAGRGRQIRNRIEAGHDRLAGLVAPGAAAGIARLMAGEA